MTQKSLIHFNIEILPFFEKVITNNSCQRFFISQELMFHPVFFEHLIILTVGFKWQSIKDKSDMTGFISDILIFRFLSCMITSDILSREQFPAVSTATPAKSVGYLCKITHTHRYTHTITLGPYSSPLPS